MEAEPGLHKNNFNMNTRKLCNKRRREIKIEICRDKYQKNSELLESRKWPCGTRREIHRIKDLHPMTESIMASVLCY